MGTKQVQMEFQVAANDGVSAQVTVTVNGSQAFSGGLAQTVNPLPGQVNNDSQPFSLVQFDLEVEDQTDPPQEAHDSSGQWVILKDVIITVTGGNIALQETLANYTATLVEVTPPATWQVSPGDAATFATLRYATQPVWTPAAVGRLDITDNTGTGPGSLLLLNNESVSYQVSMTLYSA